MNWLGNRPALNKEGPRIHILNPADGGIFYWLFKLSAFAFLVVFVPICIAGALTYGYFAKNAPPTPNLQEYANTVARIGRMYAADGTLLGEFANEWREITPFDQMPQQLINAFLAAEDHEFFEHDGLYYRGILRALSRDLVTGDFAQGASTITQQVVKQFLGSEKSLHRKINEAFLAWRLEDRYSKKAILSVYLNHIYLGNGAYGVASAARRYFAKSLNELTIEEMAMIAGLAQAPSTYSPTRSIKRAIQRRNEILKRMALHGYVTKEEANTLQEKKVSLVPYDDPTGARSPYYVEHARRVLTEKYGANAVLENGWQVELAVAPVTDALAYENVDFGARKQDKRQGFRGPVASLDGPAREVFLKRARKLYGKKELQPKRRYLGLVTSVRPQAAMVTVGENELELPLKNMRWASPWSAMEAVNDVPIERVGDALRVGDVIWVSKETVVDRDFQDWYLAKGVNPHWIKPLPPEQLERKRQQAEGRVLLEQVPHPQAAIFTADHKTGYVTAMVGGTDVDRSEYNRAVQACRQPGSTYKPIYYSAALAKGYGYDSALNDIPRAEVDPVTGEVWTPENFGGTVDNKVTLEYAMVFSKNVASVYLFKKVGADNVAKWARRLGFTTQIIADKALALGASCTKLHELTRAFAIFARNGRFVDWRWFRRVVAQDGSIVLDNTVYFDPMLNQNERLDRIAATAGTKDLQAIPVRAAWLTSKLLRQTIRHGFSAILRNTGVVAAGKTGTSSATMDNTFVAYTSRWITTVWMGDDLRQRPLGVNDAAYMTVEPMWSRYMAAATQGHENAEIPWLTPPGIKRDDRGDHKVGTTMEMDLTYRKAPGVVAPITEVEE